MANNIEDRKHLVHIHSSVKDKEPTGKAAQSMLVGELAVNNNAGFEFISTKNTSGEMARFSSDAVIDRKIMFDSGTGENAVVQRGGGNTAEGENSLALNKGTATLNEAETASGRYNKPSKSSEVFGDSGNTLFTVGNGLSEYDRSNAFEVMQNGDTNIKGNVNAESIETTSGPNVFHGDTFIESADTLYNINDIIDDLNEAIGESTEALSAAIDTLSAETFEAIEDLSAETFETIDELSAATFNNFRFEPDSTSAPEDSVKVTFVSNDGTETSHYMQYDTELSSGSVNAVQNKILKATVDEIYEKIEKQGEDTDKKIEFLSGTIDDLSAETFETIDSLSATTDQKIADLSAETFNTIEELSAKTFSSLDIEPDSSAAPENSVKFTLNRYGEEPEVKYLQFDTELSSGSVNAVQNKVLKTTVDEIYEVIGHQEEDINEKIDFLSGTIDDLSAETFETIDDLSAETFETIDALSAKTVSDITLTPRTSAAAEDAVDVKLISNDGTFIAETSVKLDTELSSGSVNAVENRIIKAEVDKIYDTIESASTDLEDALEQLSAETFNDFAFAPNSSAAPEDSVKVTFKSNDGTETSHFMQFDTELSSGSVNGVQNRVIKAAIDALDDDTKEEIDEIKRRLDVEEDKSDIFSGDIADLKAESFASADYDSSAKTIYFYNKAGEEIDSIDATAFTKDGMVYSAYIDSDDLVIVFNTDAGGKEPIRIPLVQIFNPDDYYTTGEIDTFIGEIKATKIIAGEGLAGGGPLSADVEVSLEVLESQGTYIKNVVDKFGRVTSGSATITSDDVLVSGDTLTQVMTDNEEVVSAALNDLNARIIANSGAIATIISQEGVSEEKIREMEGRLDNHQERIENLEGRMTTAERNILSNSGAIADNKAEIADNRAAIEIVSGNLDTVSAQAEANRVDIADLKSRVATEEGHSEVFSAAIDDLSSRMTSAETAIQEIIEEGVIGDEAFKELSGKVEDLSATTEVMYDNIEIVSGDVKDLEERVAAEENRSEIFSANIDTLFDTTNILREDVNSVSGQVEWLSGVIEDNELTVSAALNDLNARISGLNPTQIVETKLESSIFYEYTANTQAIIDGKASKTQVDDIEGRVDALETATSDIDEISDDVQQNITNITVISGDVQQTKADVLAVSGAVAQNKVDIQTISGLSVDNKTNIEAVSAKTTQNADDIADLKTDSFASVDYVSSAETIFFYNKEGDEIGSIDATDFVKDGMISSAYVDSNNLVIVFNTDAGSKIIEVPIGDIFDADNYYTKVQTDALISGVTNWVEEQHYLTEHQSLSAYSTTSEIDAMIISATADKANKTVTINAGTGLDGGGNLMGDITISLEPTGTAGKYLKVQTDAYGRVTSGSNTISSDDIMVTPVSSLTDCIIENELIVSAALNDLKLATISGSSEEARYAAQMANAAADRAFSAASEADEAWSSVTGDIATLFEQEAQETAERKEADNDLMLKVSQLLTRIEVLESLQDSVETVSTPEDIAAITDPSTTNVIVTSEEALASMTAATTYKTVTVVGSDLNTTTTLKASDKVIVDGMTVNGGKAAQGNGKVNYSAPAVELKNVTVASGSSAYNVFEGSQATANTLNRLDATNITVDNTELKHNVVNVYVPADNAAITVKDSYFNMNAENSNVMRISNYGNATGVNITFENIDWTYDNAEVSSYSYAGLLLYQATGIDKAATGDTSVISTWTVRFKNCTYNGVKVNSNNFGTIRQAFYAYGINGGGVTDPSTIEGLTIIFE